MKNLILSIAVLLFGAAQVSAQEKSTNGPVITFEKPSCDYGTIDKGSNRVRDFVITNNGNEPLIIQNATGSCGCTVPEWPRDPIMPKQRAVIKINYDTNREGPFSKTVTLYSNAINNNANGTVSFTVKGEVRRTAQTSAPVQNQGSPVMNR